MGKTTKRYLNFQSQIYVEYPYPYSKEGYKLEYPENVLVIKLDGIEKLGDRQKTTIYLLHKRGNQKTKEGSIESYPK